MLQAEDPYREYFTPSDAWRKEHPEFQPKLCFYAFDGVVEHVEVLAVVATTERSTGVIGPCACLEITVYGIPTSRHMNSSTQLLKVLNSPEKALGAPKFGIRSCTAPCLWRDRFSDLANMVIANQIMNCV